jgi:hypothetical protein
MTEQGLMKTFRDCYFWMQPKNIAAFDAYINGETDEWPKGIEFELSFDDGIIAELGGPHDALALRMLTALGRSKKVDEVARNGTCGVRVLAAMGIPLEEVCEVSTGLATSPSSAWINGYQAVLYYEGAASFLDANLKKIAEDDATPLPHLLYGFFIAMAAGLLEKDLEKYKRYIPLVETFEARLPKLKKAASQAAQQLIAKWEALK